MQIICPNCGSKSPIEAGSLVTQTRIVCARCAVEFAAELSDEQRDAPAAGPDERGIELFRAADSVPVPHAPRHATGVEAADAELTPDVTAFTEVSTAETAPAQDAAAETEHEETAAPVEASTSVGLSPAAEGSNFSEVSNVVEISPAFDVSNAVEAEAVEAAAAGVGSRADAAEGPASGAVESNAFGPAAGDAHEVLSLPVEAAHSGEAARAEAFVEADHSNVLEDVFAAWTQSREPGAETEASEVAPLGAADDYVTSPLPSDYEAAARGLQQPEAESAGRTPGDVLEVANADVVEPGASAAEEADETADGEGGTVDAGAVQARPADVAPQLGAAKSFDGYGLGVRLMRVSPLWLLVSGLSFISFVVFCNWFFVPSNVAQADAARPASHRNEASNRSPAAFADTSAARPDASNSDTSGATLPAEAEVVKASLKIEEPTPAPTVAPPAPTLEPAAAPKAEQPKAEEAAAAQTAATGRFTVQVGSYNAQGEAEARAAALKSAGQPARVVEVEIPKRGKWYRVYVGGFASRADAESHGKALRGRGLADSFMATEAQ